MKNVQKIICFLLAATMCIGFTACGKQQEKTQETVISETKSVDDKKSEDDDIDDDDSDDDDAPLDLSNISVKSYTTVEEETESSISASESETVNSIEQGSSPTPSTDQKQTEKNADTASKSSSTSKSSTSNTQTVTEVKPTETEPLTDPAPEPDVPSEENVVSGVINLDDGSFEGNGIAVNGGTILITGEGTYILTGSRTGMVEVDTTQKVKLKLNGVNIFNPDGPAILCTDAKKLTITLIEGTYNTLTDGANALYDGAICSNDTLEIKGAGALNINAVNAHGIASDDDIIIKNGDITVNAVKSGMMANDDITVSGGTLHVTGATNGIKSKGTLHISGGTIFTTGGPKETKSALYSRSTFTLTGGYIYALGCGASEPDPATSTQCALSARFIPSLNAGSTVSVCVDGVQYLRETSPYAMNTVFWSAPELYDGMPFTVFANDVPCGDEFVTAGIMTAVTANIP